MNERTGEVFSIASENAPVELCTISKAVAEVAGLRISHFSLAPGTDIGAETYPAPKLWLVASGEIAATDGNGGRTPLAPGDLYTTPAGRNIGAATSTGGIYTEIKLGKDTEMNNILQPGKAFALKDAIPYADGRIVNMDIASNPSMKFVLMSFDAGTGLSEHSAPGDALVFALDGAATIGYEGTEHQIKAGETFKFAKNGRHWVKAETRFKMALLLVLDSTAAIGV
ncbi:MAG: cupin [Kiritimatiellae bacterium]|nr:cupin [Kiritimatiellia bacterium]